MWEAICWGRGGGLLWWYSPLCLNLLKSGYNIINICILFIDLQVDSLLAITTYELQSWLRENTRTIPSHVYQQYKEYLSNTRIKTSQSVNERGCIKIYCFYLMLKVQNRDYYPLILISTLVLYLSSDSKFAV